MSTACGPASSRLHLLCLGFCAYAVSNLFHYVRTTHFLDVPFLDPKFASQVPVKRLR